MAQSYVLEIDGSHTLEKKVQRKQKVYVSKPDGGITSETGMIQIIAGYGGNAQSNVYKKMRDIFSDEYNAVVLQCNYLGWEFMQNSSEGVCERKIDDSYYAAILHKQEDEINNIFRKNPEFAKEIYKKHGYHVDIKFHENDNKWNEMGFFQALDNINALMAVQKKLKEQGLTWNKKKIIVYGHSHGAYLAHLCNILSNGYNMVIDNSAYIFPYYIFNKRVLKIQTDDYDVVENIVYRISTLEFDADAYDLNVLYRNSKNRAKIIAFQGTADFMTAVENKINLIQEIKDAELEIIDESRIDHVIFKSNTHGMNADFLELFRYTYDKYYDEKIMSDVEVEEKSIVLSKWVYQTAIKDNEVVIKREKNYSQEIDTWEMIKEYTPHLSEALSQVIAELEDDKISDETCQYLEQIIDGLNWEIMALISIMDYLKMHNIKGFKQQIESVYSAFESEYGKSAWKSLSMVIENKLLPLLRKIDDINNLLGEQHR